MYVHVHTCMYYKCCIYLIGAIFRRLVQPTATLNQCPSPYLLQQGVPMVASSPVRHEPPPNMQQTPIDVQSYPTPWKALSEFGMTPADLDQSGPPPFQQLVSAFGGDPTSDDDSSVTLDDTPVVSMATMMSANLHHHHHHHQHHHHAPHQHLPPFHRHAVPPLIMTDLG